MCFMYSVSIFILTIFLCSFNIVTIVFLYILMSTVMSWGSSFLFNKVILFRILYSHLDTNISYLPYFVSLKNIFTVLWLCQTPKTLSTGVGKTHRYFYFYFLLKRSKTFHALRRTSCTVSWHCCVHLNKVWLYKSYFLTLTNTGSHYLGGVIIITP